MKITKPFLLEPQIMFQPKGLWSKVIYPNRKRLPIIRSLPIDTIEKNMVMLKGMYNKGKDIYNKGKFDPKEVLNTFVDQKKAKMLSKIVDKVQDTKKDITDKIEDTKKIVTDKVEDTKKQTDNKLKNVITKKVLKKKK